MNGNSTLRFSVFELDLNAGELRRNGSKIRLQEQPFQILVTLLERPGEVVSRDELRSKLWPADTFVDFDHGLNAAIRRLREALGDSADTPRFVETVARRGYRFIVPVTNSSTTKLESTQEALSEDIKKAPPYAPLESERRGASPRGRTAWWIGLVIATALIIAMVAIGLRLLRRSEPLSVTQRRLTANRASVPVRGAALSSNGKYLAFADTTGIFLLRVDTGETHPLAIPAGLSGKPESWFPDNEHLVFSMHSKESATSSLWNISALGGEPRLLADNGWGAAVSPDGSQIAFVKGIGSAQEIWVMQADGQKPVKRVDCKGCFLGGMAWSPNGKELAYVKQQYEMGSFWGFDTQLEILDLDSNRSALLLSHVGPALAWTADSRLIYTAGEPTPNQSDSNIWAIRLDASGLHSDAAPERITSGTGLISLISASADGKAIAILRRTLQPNVYFAELLDHGAKLSTPRLLTPDEWYDLPTAWTADSKSVLFFSDRDGIFHIFKQAIDQTHPELLVGGSEAVALPRLSPDGSMVLYIASTTSPLGMQAAKQHAGIAPGAQRIMRVPVTGGPPQLVLEGAGINNLQCARSPSTLCIYSELAPGEEHFYMFDSIKGKGEEIPRATIRETDFYSFNWTLSPDGKTLAFSKKYATQGQPGIRLLSLSDGKERTIPLSGWTGIATLDWSADGQSLWAAAFITSETTSGLWTTGFNETGEWSLLKVDLSGKITSMLRANKLNLGWAIPSPDNKKLAIWEAVGSSNVWLVESH